jgi:hypothetical protein
MEQGVVARDLFAGFELLDVLEEGGEAADDPALVEGLRDVVEGGKGTSASEARVAQKFEL